MVGVGDTVGVGNAVGTGVIVGVGDTDGVGETAEMVGVTERAVFSLEVWHPLRHKVLYKIKNNAFRFIPNLLCFM